MQAKTAKTKTAKTVIHIKNFAAEFFQNRKNNVIPYF